MSESASDPIIMCGMYFNCFWCCRLLIIITKEKKIKKRKAIGSKLSQLFSFLKNLKRSSTRRRYRNRSKPEIDCDEGPKRLPSMNGMHSLTSIITLTQIFFAVLPHASNVLVSCVLTA